MSGRLGFGARSTRRSTRVSVPRTSVSRVTRVIAVPLPLRGEAARASPVRPAVRLRPGTGRFSVFVGFRAGWLLAFAIVTIL